MITESATATAKAQQKKKGSMNKSESDDIKPNHEMLQRIRDKQAKRKVEIEASTHRPNKALCEREERMANVQLKVYWACFPLTASPTVLESCEARRDITGQADIVAPRKQGCNDRKQLLETLRSSIKDKGQAEAKRRNVYAPLKLRAKSETGKDPEDLNRGSKVEVGNDDLQRREFNKRGNATKHQQGEQR